MYGLEKFAHLEDKIYRTIEQVKRERREREALEREIEGLREQLAQADGEKQQLEKQMQRMINERDSIKLKVESMLQAVNTLELETDGAGK
jgi:chromosome segregation ATPase